MKSLKLLVPHSASTMKVQIKMTIGETEFFDIIYIFYIYITNKKYNKSWGFKDFTVKYYNPE